MKFTTRDAREHLAGTRDLHRERAAEMFGVTLADVTPEQRTAGKRENYVAWFTPETTFAQELRNVANYLVHSTDNEFKRADTAREALGRMLVESASFPYPARPYLGPFSLTAPDRPAGDLSPDGTVLAQSVPSVPSVSAGSEQKRG